MIKAPFTLRPYLLACCALVLVPGYAAAQNASLVEEGVAAWEQGDYERAVAIWQEPAAQGDADAQFNLGQAYQLGRGVAADLTVAQQWLFRAANQGHLQAADNLGLVLFQLGQKRDALPYLRASAARGDPRAQYVLGTALFNGDLVEQDWILAYALMSQAASQGLPQANRALAEMEKFIPVDQRNDGTALAVKLEREAAMERNRQIAGLENKDVTAVPSASPLASTAKGAPATVSAPTPARPATQAKPIETASVPPSAPPATPPPSATPSADPERVTSPPPRQPVQIAREEPVPSPKPTPKPASAKPAASSKAAPTLAAAGPWRAQLGAFSSEDRAKALWKTLSGRSAFAGLKPYYSKAGALTRLQVGPFASQAAADKLCNAIRNDRQPCLALRN